MKIKSIPPLYLLLSVLLIISFYFIFPGLNIVPRPYNLGGIILMFLGFIIVGKAKDLFKKFVTPTSFEKSTFLIAEGIFNYSRNPMYLGMVLFLTGFSICFGNIISLVIPFIFLSIMAYVFIPYEEKKMKITFGNDYLDYKRKVRRWF
ncbi:hypothetical protein ES705_03571 [subsurface metagenome]